MKYVSWTICVLINNEIYMKESNEKSLRLQDDVMDYIFIVIYKVFLVYFIVDQHMICT